MLVPTRELAIQVAEAFQRYAVTPERLSRAADLRRPELHAAAQGLKRGAHVIVGTPGRVMDHMKSGALDALGSELPRAR